MNLIDSKFTNIMCDIETADKKPTSAILQIACAVMGNQELSFPFEGTVGMKHEQHGRTISLDTMFWWAGDDKRNEARKQVWKLDGQTLYDVVRNFTMHLDTIHSSLGKPLRIWTKGPSFDIGIILSACEQYSLEFPISFREFKCYRTVADLYPSITQKMGMDHYYQQDFSVREFAAHSAYGDVILQGFHLMLIAERSGEYGLVQF
jgi:hypothetical protein